MHIRADSLNELIIPDPVEKKSLFVLVQGHLNNGLEGHWLMSEKNVDALFIHHRITACPSTPVQAECYLAGGGCCLESRTWRSRGSGRSSCSESEPASRRKNKVRSSQASRHKVKSQCYDWRPLRNRGCNFILHHTGKIRWMELKTKSKDLFVPQCGELLQSMRKNRRGGSIWAKKQIFGWIYGTCGRCNTTQDEEVWWKKGSRWRER